MHNMFYISILGKNFIKKKLLDKKLENVTKFDKNNIGRNK